LLRQGPDHEGARRLDALAKVRGASMHSRSKLQEEFTPRTS